MIVTDEINKIIFNERYKDIPADLLKKVSDIIIFQISIFLVITANKFNWYKINNLITIIKNKKENHNHPFLLLNKILGIEKTSIVDDILTNFIVNNQYFNLIYTSSNEDMYLKVFESNPIAIRSIILSKESYNISDEIALKLCEMYNIILKNTLIEIYNQLIDNKNFEYHTNIDGLNEIINKKPLYKKLPSTIVSNIKGTIEDENYLISPNTIQRSNTDFSYQGEFGKLLSDLEDVFIIRYLQYQSLGLKYEYIGEDLYNSASRYFLGKIFLGKDTDEGFIVNIAENFKKLVLDKKDFLNYKIKSIVSITDFQKNKDIIDMHNRFSLGFFGLFLANTTKDMDIIQNFGDNICLTDDLKPPKKDKFSAISFPTISYNMKLKPLAKEVIDYYNNKRIKSVLNLVKEKDCVGNIGRFFNEYRTSSDDFYYAIENGYIDYQLLTDTPFEKLTTSDLLLLRWYDETFFDFF